MKKNKRRYNMSLMIYCFLSLVYISICLHILQPFFSVHSCPTSAEKRDIDWGWHVEKKQKSLHRSLPMRPYVRVLPLSNAAVDPCGLSIASVFSPTCSLSLGPPLPFHVPSATRAAAGTTLHRRRKGTRPEGKKEGRKAALSAWAGLNHYQGSLCAPTKE